MSAAEKSPSFQVRCRGWALTGLRVVLSFLAGLTVALMLSYLLYRVGLPSKPFIYVSF
jgi:hypothetical protein